MKAWIISQKSKQESHLILLSLIAQCHVCSYWPVGDRIICEEFKDFHTNLILHNKVCVIRCWGNLAFKKNNVGKENESFKEVCVCVWDIEFNDFILIWFIKSNTTTAWLIDLLNSKEMKDIAEITIKMKTIVQKPLMIEMKELYSEAINLWDHTSFFS